MERENVSSVTDNSRGRNRTFALVGRDLVFEIPISIFRAMRDLAKRENFTLLYFSGERYNSPFAFDMQPNILYDLLSPRIVDGLIVLSNLLTSPASPQEFLDRCMRLRPLPIVSLGIDFPGVPSVVLDNSEGMLDAVSHLIEVHGFRRIAFVKGMEGHPDAIERFTAYIRAMEMHGLPVEENLLLEGDFQYDSGTEAVRELLDIRGKIPGRDVQAIVCCNDYMASGVMIELQRRGILVPDEIAIVGFDDIPFSAITNPGLSTIHQPFDVLADKAAELLLSLIDGKTVPAVEHVGARFISRGSCGCEDTIDHTERIPLPKDFEKLVHPVKLSSHLNSQIVKSIKPTLALWNHAISHLWRENKWNLFAETADSSSACSRDAWALLSRVAYNTFNGDNYQTVIYNIGNVLASTLELSELVTILAGILPEAGIERCCICLYEKSENTPGVFPARSSLILAFGEAGSEKFPPGGLRFATTEFLPEEIVAKQGWKSWVIIPLFVKDEQLGYALMDIDAPHENIHWNLRNQISSALMGARLLDETRQANEQKTQFFINIAHETKTPLTLIQNYLALFMEQFEPNDKLLVIKENIDLLLSHMLNFLDAERLAKGETIYRHDTLVDLSEAARRKCEIFKAMAAKKNIRITIGVEDRVLIGIDPGALDRILNNLLDNAVKYIQNDGRIAIDVLRDGGKALLRVSDNGPGLSAEISEHIFEPYYLLSKKKSGQQGIGVGLSIVKKIIDEFGASITVEKGKGGGTCFTISFTESVATGQEEIREIPQALPFLLHVPQTIKENDTAEDKRSLLVVDDNIQLLKFIQTSFSETYNVFLARNTDEALIKLRIIPRPDVIVSDIMMDGTDGFGLLSMLQEKDGYNDIPFIFLTALGGENEKLKGFDLGAVDYIEKPFSITTLRAKIESIIALRGRQERKDRQLIRSSIDGLLSGSRSNMEGLSNAEFESACKKYGIRGREKEIIQMLARRLANKEIASLLSLSQRTVEYHITKIFKKCGVTNKYELLDKFQI